MILLITSAIVQQLVIKSNGNTNVNDRLLMRIEVANTFEVLASGALHNYLIMLQTIIVVIQHYLVKVISLIQINKNTRNENIRKSVAAYEVGHKSTEYQFGQTNKY